MTDWERTSDRHRDMRMFDKFITHLSEAYIGIDLGVEPGIIQPGAITSSKIQSDYNDVKIKYE